MVLDGDNPTGRPDEHHHFPAATTAAPVLAPAHTGDIIGALFFLVVIDLVVFSLTWLVHPSPTQLAEGMIPSWPGGLNATLLLFLIGLIGTTVEA